MKVFALTGKTIYALATAATLAFSAGCAFLGDDTLQRADAGDREMQYEMAIRYKTGKGVPVDNEKARMYLEKSFENGYTPAACDIASEIHEKELLDKSEKLIKCYDFIFGMPSSGKPSVRAQKKFSESFPRLSQSYFTRLAESGKKTEALKYRECVLKYLNRTYCRKTRNIDSYRDYLIQYSFPEKEEPIRVSEPEDGIKLYQSIFSSHSVQKIFSKVCAEYTPLNDGTVFCISMNGAEDYAEDFFTSPLRKLAELVEKISAGPCVKAFFAGFHEIVDYNLDKENLKKAPSGFLFGAFFKFSSIVSANALENKIKKEYPEIKELSVQKQTKKYKSERGFDFDVVTITRKLESERIRITFHHIELEFSGDLFERQKIWEEYANNPLNFNWPKDQITGIRLDGYTPGKLGESTMIIVDKNLESKMPEITREAKKRYAEAREKARKMAEEKILGF